MSFPQTITISSTPYTILYKIGQGQQGTVYFATDPQSRPFALKKIPIRNQHFRALLYRQITLHTSCLSPNIIKFYDSQEINDELYIILELGECNLTKYLEMKEGGVLSEGEVMMLIGDVAGGLEEVHKNEIVHRDIKGDNVIVKEGVFKVSDFGVSGDGGGRNTFIGTPIYLAPEVLGNRTNYVNPSVYGGMVDVWALGVMAFEVYFGVHPFYWDIGEEMNWGKLVGGIGEVVDGKGLNVEKLVGKMRREGRGDLARKVEEKVKGTTGAGWKKLKEFWERSIRMEPRERMSAKEVRKMFEGVERVGLLGEGEGKGGGKKGGEMNQSSTKNYQTTTNLFNYPHTLASTINRSFTSFPHHPSSSTHLPYPFNLQKTQSYNHPPQSTLSSSHHLITRKNSQPPNQQQLPPSHLKLSPLDLDSFLNTTKLSILHLSTTSHSLMSIKQIQYLSLSLILLQKLSILLLNKNTNLPLDELIKFQMLSRVEKEKGIIKGLREAGEVYGELMEKWKEGGDFVARVVVRLEVCGVVVKVWDRMERLWEEVGEVFGGRKELGGFEVGQGKIGVGNWKEVVRRVRKAEEGKKA